MKSLAVTRLKWRLSVMSWCACTQWVEPPNLVTHNNQQQQPPGWIEPLGRQPARTIASVPRCQASKAGVPVACSVVRRPSELVFRYPTDLSRNETHAEQCNDVWMIKTKTTRISVERIWRTNLFGCTNNWTLYGVTEEDIQMLVRE
jgi:hypothetical protein